MTSLYEHKYIRISEDKFTFDRPQKYKSKIVSIVLNFVEDLEYKYGFLLDDKIVEDLRKSIYKNLDKMHISVLEQSGE